MKRIRILFLILFQMSLGSSVTAQDYFLKTDTLLSNVNFPYGIERYGENYVIGGITVESGVSRHMFVSMYDKGGQRVHFITRPEIDRILSFQRNNKMTIINGSVKN